jgi:membrane-associated phospholipid phosphatase
MNLLEKVGEQSIFLYELYFIYAFMAYKHNFSFLMVVLIFGNIVFNMVTKAYVMKLGAAYNHTLPLFGSLCRPIDTECKGLTMMGYGTPSGHSQIVSFVAAFYYFYYRDKEMEMSHSYLAVLVAIALFVMHTRYTSKMHSLPQIVLGSLTGVGLAFVVAKVLRFFV